MGLDTSSQAFLHSPGAGAGGSCQRRNGLHHQPASPRRGQECGLITYPRLERDLAFQTDSLQILSCFWHHYQRCQPATISLSAYAVDVGSDTTMTVEQRSIGCDVYIRINGRVNVTSYQLTFRCASMIQQGVDLYLSLCDHNQPAFEIDIESIIAIFCNCDPIGPPTKRV